MFQNLVWQLREYHPQSTIHLLTNRLRRDSRVEIHYRPNLPLNSLAKFYAFGLLKVPAVFLDIDIWLARPLRRTDLPNIDCEPFVFFRGKDRDFKRWLLPRVSLPGLTHRFNSGVVYITKPSPELSQELFSIHARCFRNIYPLDELALSYYSSKMGLTHLSSATVNVDSWSIKKKTALSDSGIHSIHFPGPNKKDRLLRWISEAKHF
jgi:hypothetical protein